MLTVTKTAAQAKAEKQAFHLDKRYNCPECGKRDEGPHFGITRTENRKTGFFSSTSVHINVQKLSCSCGCEWEFEEEII